MTIRKAIALLFVAATATAASTSNEVGGLLKVKILGGQAATEDTEDAAEGFEVGAEEKFVLTGRSADLSGCGVHRTCTACRDQNLPGACYWNPGTGCVKNWNPNQRSVCTAQNNVAPKCSAFQDCNSCTIQNGCVFHRGKCAYSRGTNCMNDPQNCVSYSWECPASPQPLYFDPKPQPAPVQVQTPDRIDETVSRVEDMIIGMSAAELRRLRNELDAMLIAAEASAVTPAYNYPPYASPYSASPYSASPYSTAAASSPYTSPYSSNALNSQLFGLDWATTASSAQPSSYPATFAAPKPAYSTPYTNPSNAANTQTPYQTPFTTPGYASANPSYAPAGTPSYTPFAVGVPQNGYQASYTPATGTSFGNNQQSSQPAGPQPVQWAPASSYSWGR